MTVVIRPLTEAEKAYLIANDDGMGPKDVCDGVRFLELEPEDWTLLPARLPYWMHPYLYSDGCFIGSGSDDPKTGMISLGLDWVEITDASSSHE